MRIHPSATNGDYVREVRASTPAIAGPVANVVRDVEAVQFGVTVPDAGFYQSLLGRVLPLARGVLGGGPAPRRVRCCSC